VGGCTTGFGTVTAGLGSETDVVAFLTAPSVAVPAAVTFAFTFFVLVLMLLNKCDNPGLAGGRGRDGGEQL
jgi:hypothetical protein